MSDWKKKSHAGRKEPFLRKEEKKKSFKKGSEGKRGGLEFIFRRGGKRE